MGSELKTLQRALQDANATIRRQAADLAHCRRDNSLLVEANRRLKVELGARGGFGAVRPCELAARD